jgi:hypothetical protein
MELITNYRQIHRSKSLDDLAKIKTERLLKKFHLDGTIVWTFSKKDQGYLSELYFKNLTNEFYVKSISDNFFKTLEPNLSKLEEQIEFHFMENNEELGEIFSWF